MSGTIQIQGIDCYSYHGCLEEEAKIGQRYDVDVLLELDLTTSTFSDNLNDTVDYENVTLIVRKEMAIRSKLIEHVAGRILLSIKNKFPLLKAVSVTIHKFNPPVNAYFEKASVTLSEKLE